MVGNNRFAEMDVELWKLRRRIAHGRLKTGARLATFGVKVNSTAIDVS